MSSFLLILDWHTDLRILDYRLSSPPSPFCGKTVWLFQEVPEGREQTYPFGQPLRLGGVHRVDSCPHCTCFLKLKKLGGQALKSRLLWWHWLHQCHPWCIPGPGALDWDVNSEQTSKFRGKERRSGSWRSINHRPTPPLSRHHGKRAHRPWLRFLSSCFFTLWLPNASPVPVVETTPSRWATGVPPLPDTASETPLNHDGYYLQTSSAFGADTFAQSTHPSVRARSFTTSRRHWVGFRFGIRWRQKGSGHHVWQGPIAIG